MGFEALQEQDSMTQGHAGRTVHPLPAWDAGARERAGGGGDLENRSDARR